MPAPTVSLPRLQHLPHWGFAVLALVTVVLVGTVDYLSGHEILLSTFYLVPVALAAWMVGRAFAVVVSVLSVGAWLIGDLASGAVYPRPFVPAWNAAIVLAFYLVVVVLLRRLRHMHRELEERVRLRTVALTEQIAERERLERELLGLGERERRRIGRDLHDSLGQLLTGAALAGQVLRERLAARGVPESSDAARLVELAEEAIEMTRSLSRGLDPVQIGGGGLAQGLRELAAQTNRLSPMRCEYSQREPVAIHDDEIVTHLYRIAQEALANAMKHGQARRVLVRLDGGAGRVRLTVHDDGVGIPEAGRRGLGMGLRIMAHRAEVMGGTFSVSAGPAGGTTVVCEVPNP